MTSDLIVTIRHVRAASLCARGGRAWFQRHGMSWTAFLSDGVPASTLRALNDPLANRAVAEAEKEQADG